MADGEDTKQQSKKALFVAFLKGELKDEEYLNSLEEEHREALVDYKEFRTQAETYPKVFQAVVASFGKVPDDAEFDALVKTTKEIKEKFEWQLRRKQFADFLKDQLRERRLRDEQGFLDYIEIEGKEYCQEVLEYRDFDKLLRGRHKAMRNRLVVVLDKKLQEKGDDAKLPELLHVMRETKKEFEWQLIQERFLDFLEGESKDEEYLNSLEEGHRKALVDYKNFETQAKRYPKVFKAVGNSFYKKTEEVPDDDQLTTLVQITQEIKEEFEWQLRQAQLEELASITDRIAKHQGILNLAERREALYEELANGWIGARFEIGDIDLALTGIAIEQVQKELKQEQRKLEWKRKEIKDQVIAIAEQQGENPNGKKVIANQIIAENKEMLKVHLRKKLSAKKSGIRWMNLRYFGYFLLALPFSFIPVPIDDKDNLTLPAGAVYEFWRANRRRRRAQIKAFKVLRYQLLDERVEAVSTLLIHGDTQRAKALLKQAGELSTLDGAVAFLKKENEKKKEKLPEGGQIPENGFGDNPISEEALDQKAAAYRVLVKEALKALETPDNFRELSEKLQDTNNTPNATHNVWAAYKELRDSNSNKADDELLVKAVDLVWARHRAVSEMIVNEARSLLERSVLNEASKASKKIAHEALNKLLPLIDKSVLGLASDDRELNKKLADLGRTYGCLKPWIDTIISADANERKATIEHYYNTLAANYDRLPGCAYLFTRKEPSEANDNSLECILERDFDAIYPDFDTAAEAALPDTENKADLKASLRQLGIIALSRQVSTKPKTTAVQHEVAEQAELLQSFIAEQTEPGEEAKIVEEFRTEKEKLGKNADTIIEAIFSNSPDVNKAIAEAATESKKPNPRALLSLRKRGASTPAGNAPTNSARSDKKGVQTF